MIRGSGLTLLWLLLASLLIGVLFALYRTPLMEIYLANWMLC